MEGTNKRDRRAAHPLVLETGRPQEGFTGHYQEGGISPMGAVDAVDAREEYVLTHPS